MLETKRFAVLADAPPPGATAKGTWPMRIVSESDRPLGAALRAFVVIAQREDTNKVYVYDRWGNAQIWAPSAIPESNKERCQTLFRFLKGVHRWSLTYRHYRKPGTPHSPVGESSTIIG